MNSPRARILAAALLVIGSAALASVLLTRPEKTPSLRLQIGSRTVQLAEGATLAVAIRAFGLHPRAGRLLDVNGSVLRPDAFPGVIRLDGRPASPQSRLQDGERISIVNGLDRKEPLSRRTVRVRNGLQDDPQFTIARAPGEELVVRGAVSHELVSTRFRTL